MTFSLTEICLIAVILLLLFVLVTVLVIYNKNGGQDNLSTRFQAEVFGRLKMLAEQNSYDQAKIAHAIDEQKLSMLKIIDEKLLQVSQNVGEGLRLANAKTDESLSGLKERLARIDVAQQKISSLSEQVVSLQEILSNKQARGAFGEIQLNDLVSSVLPPSAYEFQYTLENQKRADCLIRLPNPPGMIVVDSKFPLESYHALRQAQTENQKAEASRFFRNSLLKHIKDISQKYIIPGQTADSALMFLPSEAIYAELYTNFEDVVENSFRSRVWIVSPTTLMATLNTVRAILKDVQTQKQAGIIQKELRFLTDDVNRLDERTENLAKHFELAVKDVREIRTSSEGISRHIGRIEDLKLDSMQNTTDLSSDFTKDSA